MVCARAVSGRLYRGSMGRAPRCTGDSNAGASAASGKRSGAGSWSTTTGMSGSRGSGRPRMHRSTKLHWAGKKPAPIPPIAPKAAPSAITSPTRAGFPSPWPARRRIGLTRKPSACCSGKSSRRPTAIWPAAGCMGRASWHAEAAGGNTLDTPPRRLRPIRARDDGRIVVMSRQRGTGAVCEVGESQDGHHLHRRGRATAGPQRRPPRPSQ